LLPGVIEPLSITGFAGLSGAAGGLTEVTGPDGAEGSIRIILRSTRTRSSSAKTIAANLTPRRMSSRNGIYKKGSVRCARCYMARRDISPDAVLG